jgi:hypothetical protein
MADFRAIYHLGWREAMQLPGYEFLILAQRLPDYPGILAKRAEQEKQRERRNVRNPEARMVDIHDPSLAGLIQVG